jgi:hypothetical protein
MQRQQPQGGTKSEVDIVKRGAAKLRAQHESIAAAWPLATAFQGGAKFEAGEGQRAEHGDACRRQ